MKHLVKIWIILFVFSACHMTINQLHNHEHANALINYLNINLNSKDDLKKCNLKVVWHKFENCLLWRHVKTPKNDSLSILVLEHKTSHKCTFFLNWDLCIIWKLNK